MKIKNMFLLTLMFGGIFVTNTYGKSESDYESFLQTKEILNIPDDEDTISSIEELYLNLGNYHIFLNI